MSADIFDIRKHHTEVSELIRSTNLLDFGSIISSEIARWGKAWTVQRRETSPCLSWNTVPVVRERERRVSQISAQDCGLDSSRSF